MATESETRTAFGSPIIAEFFGDAGFPVEWKDDEEKKLHWWFDDLHCPHPLSPMFADMSGWWGPVANYAFARFAFPGEKAWPGKVVNGYLFSAIIPSSPEETARNLKYYEMVKPEYASRFKGWWENRYEPEIRRNFDYLDSYDYEGTSLEDLMILLEDTKDMYERHWHIHWILNFAQFFAFIAFNDMYRQVIGSLDTIETGHILSSFDDKNWDSVKGLWELKEVVNASPALKDTFSKDAPEAVLKELSRSAAGNEFLTKLRSYLKQYGYKAIYAHEFAYPTWLEDPSPVIELIKTYIQMDYNYYKEFYRLKGERDDAIQRMFSKVKGKDDRKKLKDSLDTALALAPLTPNHHFYIDQGTNARMRLVLMAVGRKLVERGDLPSPDDVLYLVYDELRTVVSDPLAMDARGVSAKRRRIRDEQFGLKPPNFLGTVTEWSAYQEPWKVTNWGWKLEKREKVQNVIPGVAASPGIAEGVARVVLTPEDFNQIESGDIVVCEMTNPAWMTVFPKMKALVTDAGGIGSHSAVASREFGIPAVVGTVIATREIKSGQRVKVDGNGGTVELEEARP